MFGEHRFFRTKNGVTSFAHAEVKLCPNECWSVIWSKTEGILKKVYGLAAEAALELVAAEIGKRNGNAYLVEITSLIDVPADTKSDAVECAIALAIWKASGCPEQDVAIVFEQGRWNLRFL